MEDTQRDYEVLRTYARAWKSDIVMYHLFGIPLWFPISLRQAVFFVVGIAISGIALKIIPTIKLIPFLGDPVVTYGVFPYVTMKFFTKMTLDGKPPHIYFKDQLEYMMGGRKFSRYKAIDSMTKGRYTSKTGYRLVRLVSMIDYRMKEGK